MIKISHTIFYYGFPGRRKLWNCGVVIPLFSTWLTHGSLKKFDSVPTHSILWHRKLGSPDHPLRIKGVKYKATCSQTKPIGGRRRWFACGGAKADDTIARQLLQQCFCSADDDGASAPGERTSHKQQTNNETIMWIVDAHVSSSPSYCTV